MIPVERRPIKKRSRDEDRLQMALVSKLPLILKKGWFWFHVPNGGKMAPGARRRLAAMGAIPGVPDLVFVAPPHGRAYGLELKAERGVQSDDQRAVALAWDAAGGDYHVAWGMDQALAVLSLWGALRSQRTGVAA